VFVQDWDLLQIRKLISQLRCLSGLSQVWSFRFDPIDFLDPEECSIFSLVTTLATSQGP